MSAERTQAQGAVSPWIKYIGYFVWFLPILHPDLAFPQWIELTVSGIATGALIFLMAVGLTVIFGLMDVLNFAHGMFLTLGAYTGWTVFRFMPSLIESESLAMNSLAILIGLVCAVMVTFLLGILMEKVIIMKVYGNHLIQILITMGVLIVVEELIRMIWGGNPEEFSPPFWFQDVWFIGDVLINRFHVLIIIMGGLVYGGVTYVLNRTKIGLLVRAGVENPKMVQAMGYDLYKIFTGVFAVGAALAGLGGLMWGLSDTQIDPLLGSKNAIFAFIVVIIGGMGSVGGSLLGSLMVGLATTYVAFLLPALSSMSTILLMVIILMIKPAGLFPIK